MAKNQIKAEIISTGTELLQGLYADTNAQYLSQVLAELGIETHYHTAVRDDADALRGALKTAKQRANIIIITGGLGPTADDVTRQVVSQFFQSPLVRDKKAEQLIIERYKSRGLDMPPGILVQADVPQNALPLYNEVGTATGFIIPGEQKKPICIGLPGPSREFLPMLNETVIPYLKQHFKTRVFLRTQVVRTFGVPESILNEKLWHLGKAEQQVSLAFLAKVGKVDIRINAQGPSEAEVNRLLSQFTKKIVEIIGEDDVYGYGEEELEFAVGNALIKKNLTIAVAESCTAGLVSYRLTNVSGSSNYISECYITYSDQAKSKLLGVSPETLSSYGAVSAQTAVEMAGGVRKRADTDIGLGITGIAGPTGGTAQKPVGLVFFALATSRATAAFKRQFKGNRHENRWWASDYALDLVRRLLLYDLAVMKLPGAISV